MEKRVKLGFLTLMLTCCMSVMASGGGGGGNWGDKVAEPQRAARKQDPDYAAGQAAIKAEDWPRAIEAMNKVVARNPRHADAYNWLGYAYRKQGDLPNAFKHYEQALAIDPKHLGVHEYLGEAYLMANDLPNAEKQLAELDKLCWFTCEEFRDLKAHIQAYKAKQAAQPAQQ
ncbi:tetratricopeptide (TPR) repeat protein [Chitinivorax tropicus]|uniref:Tetratricopeptide (TPR) repeat protein n=1 Tax=Chitinivorax tropicus TaxID=714531 RepID=A0A840MSZ1_9PROT|nr:tetratricopeptide repeat protein [Chitinivorax tropicus]MBB5018331.1 tetratricopeptide (TPR) repeat protein [Chitinivorax tropicus]